MCGLRCCAFAFLWERACSRRRPDSRPILRWMHSIPLWERACSRRRPDSRPIFCWMHSIPLWERACSRRRPDSRPVSCRCTHSNCRSEPARDGSLPTDQFLAGGTQFQCGSELAREGGLSGKANPSLLTLADSNAKSTAITTEYVQFTGACRALGYKE